MRSLILGFVLGVCCLQQQARLPDEAVLAALAVSAALLLACFPLVDAARAIPVPRSARIPVLLLSGGLLGFAWAGHIGERALTPSLPGDLENRDLSVVGTVASLPYRFNGGVRFNLKVEPDAAAPVSAAERDVMRRLPPRLALSWYESGDKDADVAPPVQPGERWLLRVRLKRRHGNANPDGFDYEVWLLEQDLRATGSVRPQQAGERGNVRLVTFVPGLDTVVERTRAWLRDRILQALPGKPFAGVVVALVVGDQRGIAQSDWAVFNRTGIGHLISISGLHITMVAGLFAALVHALWRRSFFLGQSLPLVLPAQKAAALAGALAALLYVLLAGFGVPAQRTLYMVATVALALWFGRLTAVSHVLCIALAVVVVLDPWAVLWPGFWLSFGAVAAILYATVGRNVPASDSGDRFMKLDEVGAGGERGWWPRLRDTLRGALRTQYAVTVGLVPLTILLFGQISLVSPIANAFAIPLVSLVVTPAALLGAVLPGPVNAWMLLGAHRLLEVLAAGLHWMSAPSWAVWTAPKPPLWMALMALFGTAWLLAPRGWPMRWLGLVTWLPLLLLGQERPERGMRVVAFDVGQGTAVLIETAHHRLLYDTGPTYGPQGDAGERVLLPYFRMRGIDTLDGLIVSHRDSDHSGGALSLLRNLRIDEVRSSLAEDDPIVRASASHRCCTSGQSWEWDGVRFDILHPVPASFASDKWKPNARSCTLRVSYGVHAVLLPGDIEAVQEDELVHGLGEGLRSSVLIAPHHGSRTSSTAPFLDAVRPQIAIFQAGYLNRFGHPRPDVLARYAARGIARLRSDEAGAVTLRLDEHLDVESFRRSDARYWHGR